MRRKHSALLVGAILVLALTVVGLMAGLGGVSADAPTEQDTERSITVDATGGAEAAPDQAEIELVVTADDDNPSVVRDELASGAEDLRTALDDLGVTYETSGYALEQSSQRLQEEHDVSEYVGHHSFHVTLADPDRAGEVIDAAVDAGAEVEDVELTLSEDEREALRDDAIENAMSDARQQADTIAAAGDLEVTEVATVDASQQRYRTVSYDVAVEDDAVADAPPTEIDFGDVSVTYQVEVTYNATSL